MFVDQIRIYAKAGKGGKGSASFHRGKGLPKGGPDGGDGGNGGNIILRTDVNTDNLVALYYEPIVKAKDGGNGQKNQCYGKNGADTIVPVPVGTIVYRLPAHLGPNYIPKMNEYGEMDEEEEIRKQETPELAELEQVVDLSEEGQSFILCAGGKGGRGNVHFKSANNRTPRQFGPGEPGEEGAFLLELRKIADAGLVGYPNAGKSTLLRAVSAAQPKVAPYPFTTLHPHIGVVDFPNYARATIADIPGLIEGAHNNVGLGHDFLRHITRCKLLLFVIDMAGSEGRNPVEDLIKLREELSLYDRSLSERPWFVVANKMDLPEAEEHLKTFRSRFPKRTIIPVSADKGEGIDAFKQAFAMHLGIKIR